MCDLVNDDYILIKVGLPYLELTSTVVHSALLKLDKNNLTAVKMLVNFRRS